MSAARSPSPPRAPSDSTTGRRPVQRRIESIQALRFVAAAMVVCFHAVLPLRRLYPEFGSVQVPAGAAGVDVFFVISGFIITVVIARGGEGGRAEFIRNRIVRIVPIYWVLTIALAILTIAVPQVFHSTDLQPWHLIGSLFFIPVLHPVLGEFRPLLVPGWTLNYEMFFYACSAVVLPLPLRARLRFLGLFFVVLAACYPLVPRDSVLSFYSFPIILEFVAGMCLARLYLSGRGVPGLVRWAALLAAAAIFALSVALGTAEGWNRVVFWGVPATLLVFYALTGPAAGWMKARVVQHLGDASYSTYLVHLFAQGAVAAVLGRVGAGGWLPWPLAYLALVGSGIVAGSILHVAVELPLQRLLRRRAVPA